MSDNQDSVAGSCTTVDDVRTCLDRGQSIGLTVRLSVRSDHRLSLILLQLTAEAGLISLAFIFVLALLILVSLEQPDLIMLTCPAPKRNVWRNSRLPERRRRSLIDGPADALMVSPGSSMSMLIVDNHAPHAPYLQLSLFVADLLQAIGAALDVRWVQTGSVQTGGFCTAQGMSITRLMCKIDYANRDHTK